MLHLFCKQHVVSSEIIKIIICRKNRTIRIFAIAFSKFITHLTPNRALRNYYSQPKKNESSNFVTNDNSHVCLAVVVVIAKVKIKNFCRWALHYVHFGFSGFKIYLTNSSVLLWKDNREKFLKHIKTSIGHSRR